MSPTVTIPVNRQMIDHADISRCSVNCGLVRHSTAAVTRANSEYLQLWMRSNVTKISNSCIENPDSVALLQQSPNKSGAQQPRPSGNEKDSLSSRCHEFEKRVESPLVLLKSFVRGI